MTNAETWSVFIFATLLLFAMTLAASSYAYDLGLQDGKASTTRYVPISTFANYTCFRGTFGEDGL